MINVEDYMPKFTGFDAVVLGNMAKAFNFSVSMQFNPDKYGIKFNETAFNGMDIRMYCFTIIRTHLT